jgi:type I restriction enzyme S subunit
MKSLPAKALGRLCTVVAGGTPTRGNTKYWNGDIAWVKISDMLQGIVQTTEETITEEGLNYSAAKLLPRGTLIFSIFATIGRSAVLDIDAATNQAIVGLIPKSDREVDVNYLRRFLDSQASALARRGRGGAQRNINSSILKSIDIPLPPLDEQRRIAAVLDKADALRRHRQESLQLAENLLQSVFLNMFGDPAANSMDWPTQELGNFGMVRTGNTPPRSNKANYAPDGMEWIKTDNIVEDCVVVTPAVEHLSELGMKSARIAPPDSLLVACIAGSEKSIGRAALTDRKVAFNQQINAITPHADTSPLFLYFLVKLGRRQIQLAAGKGMKKMINKSTFESLRFIAPSYKEQLQFEQIAWRIIEHKKNAEEQFLCLERFLGALQQRAFRGELDLSRLQLAREAEAPAVTPVPQPVVVEGRYTRPGSFIAPADIEQQLLAMEKKLEGDKAEQLPWSENFFKYRTLSQILQPPFSFAKIWSAVEKDFAEPDYETIKNKVFEYVAAGVLKQEFSEEHREIVFRPRT